VSANLVCLNSHPHRNCVFRGTCKFAGGVFGQIGELSPPQHDVSAVLSIVVDARLLCGLYRTLGGTRSQGHRRRSIVYDRRSKILSRVGARYHRRCRLPSSPRAGIGITLK
ncbi:MAG: hypothetical protein ABR584_12855, partial [Candidatus Baltobacteraceae bacterium]